MNKKNIKKINARLVLIFFVLIFFNSTKVFAASEQAISADPGQSNEAKSKVENFPSPPEKPEAINPNSIIAQVEITDFSIKETKNGEYDVSLTLINQEYFQPQILASLILIKDEDQKQIQADRIIFGEELTLGPKETREVKTKYKIPAFLDGSYKLYADVRNKSGTPLALVLLKEINLQKSQDSFEIDESSCQVKTEKKIYDFREIAFISQNSPVLISCQVKNSSQISRNAYPKITARSTSDFGDILAQEKGEKTFFGPNEKKEVIFPGFIIKNLSNISLIAFLSNEKDETAAVPYRTFLNLDEPAFSMANLRADKSYYKSGETAKLIVTPELGLSGSPNMEIEIRDKDNISCTSSDGQTKMLDKDPKKASFEWGVAIDKDCFDPKITIAIKEPAGRVVGQSSYLIKTSQEALIQIEKNKELQKNEIKKKAISLIPVFLLIVILVYLIYKRKREFREKYIFNKSGKNNLLLLAFISGALFWGNSAQALTAVDHENFLTLTASVPVPSRGYFYLPNDSNYQIDISLSRSVPAYRYVNGVYTPCTPVSVSYANVSVETLGAYDAYSLGELPPNNSNSGLYNWYSEYNNHSNWQTTSINNGSLANNKTLYASKAYAIPRFNRPPYNYGTTQYPWLVRLKIGGKVYFTFNKCDPSYWGYAYGYCSDSSYWDNGLLVSENYLGKTMDGLSRTSACDYFGLGTSSSIGTYSCSSSCPFINNYQYSIGSLLKAQKEDGVCIDKKHFDREPPLMYPSGYNAFYDELYFYFDPWCKFGSRYNTEKDQSSWHSVVGDPLNGEFKYKCKGVMNYDYSSQFSPASVNDSTCEGSVTLDGKCGWEKDKAICQVGSRACDTGNGWEVLFSSVNNFSNNSGSGPFNWTCKGIGGGSDAQCSSIAPAGMGVCGPANGGFFETRPSSTLLCASGTSKSGAQLVCDDEYNCSVSHWEWTCDQYAADGGSLNCATTCQAGKLPQCVSNDANRRYYDKMPDDNYNNVMCDEYSTSNPNEGGWLPVIESGDGSEGNPWMWHCYSPYQYGQTPKVSGQCKGWKVSSNLTANPDNINIGGSTVLSWSTPNVTSRCVKFVPNNSYDFPNNVALYGSSNWGNRYYDGNSVPINSTASVGSQNGNKSVYPHNNPGDATYGFVCRAIGTGFNSPSSCNRNFSNCDFRATAYATVNVSAPTFPANCGSATLDRSCILNSSSPNLCDASSSLKDNVTLVDDKFIWTCKSNSGGADATCKSEKYCTTDSVWREIEPN